MANKFDFTGAADVTEMLNLIAIYADWAPGTIDIPNCLGVANADGTKIGGAPPVGTADVNVVEIGGSAVAIGQAAMTASIPVVIASDQSTLNVDVTATTIGLALDASVTAMSAKLPTIIGQKTKATALGVTLASDEDDLGVLVKDKDANGISSTAGFGSAAGSRPLDIIIYDDDGNFVGNDATPSYGGNLSVRCRAGSNDTLPASLGAKTGVASLSVVEASDSAQAANIAIIAGDTTSLDGKLPSGMTMSGTNNLRVSLFDGPSAIGVSANKMPVTDSVVQGNTINLENTHAADDAVAPTRALAIGGLFESSPSSVDDGDIGQVGISADRHLLVDADITANGIGLALDATISAMSAKLPATLGAKTKALSLATTRATDEDTYTVDGDFINLDCFEATTGFTAIQDAANIATTDEHHCGAQAVTWDKSGGTNVLSMIQKTITSQDIGMHASAASVQVMIYLSALTDVVNVTARVGTDASNYATWQWAVADLIAGWNILAKPLTDREYPVTGTGVDTGAITYIATGIETGAAADTLTGIIADNMIVFKSLETTLRQSPVTLVDGPVNLGSVMHKDRNSGRLQDVEADGAQNAAHVMSNSMASEASLAALVEALKPALATTYTTAMLTIAGEQADQILHSPAADKKAVMVDLIISVKGASADVALEWDKTGGDVAAMAPMHFAALGGIPMPFHGVIACDEDGADLVVTTTSAVGATTDITAVVYEIE